MKLHFKKLQIFLISSAVTHILPEAPLQQDASQHRHSSGLKTNANPFSSIRRNISMLSGHDNSAIHHHQKNHTITLLELHLPIKLKSQINKCVLKKIFHRQKACDQKYYKHRCKDIKISADKALYTWTEHINQEPHKDKSKGSRKSG